jgi:hypothetical protein
VYLKCTVKYATRNKMSKIFARADARGLQTPMGPATLGPSQIMPGTKFRPSPPLDCKTQESEAQILEM